MKLWNQIRSIEVIDVKGGHVITLEDILKIIW